MRVSGDLEPIPDRTKPLVLLDGRRREDDGVPDLLAVDVEAVLEAALDAAFVSLDGDGAEFGVAFVYVSGRLLAIEVTECMGNKPHT